MSTFSTAVLCSPWCFIYQLLIWYIEHGLEYNQVIPILALPVVLWILCHMFLIVDKQAAEVLTHWGRMTHICVSKLTSTGSDNGLSPSRRQAIIWSNAGILLIRTLGTNFSEILSKIHTFSFKKIHLKMSSGKWRPFCLGLKVLTHYPRPVLAFGYCRCLRLSVCVRMCASTLSLSAR